MNHTPQQPPAEIEVEIIPPKPERGPFHPDAGPPAIADRTRARRSPLKAILARVPGVNTLHALWLYLIDDHGSDVHRLMILLATLYVIWPKDVLRDFLIPFGLIDDAAVIFFLIRFIGSDALEPYREKSRRLLREP